MEYRESLDSFLTLVSTEALAAHLEDPSWLVVDCRFDLTQPEKGRREYLSGHIPGAFYAGLEPDLSGPRTGANGRHPLPDVEAIRGLFGGWGVTDSTQVVAYDEKTGLWASRLWWLLRYLGHERSAVLDGGLAKWSREGRPVETALPADRTPVAFEGQPHEAMRVSVDEVAAVAGNPSWRIIDARAPERYRGEIEPIDRVAGHVPGAANLHYLRTLNADGTFLPAAALRATLRGVLADVPPERSLCYCGSGVTACHSLLAFEHAGLSGGRLYAGSWSEWSSDPRRPVATGDE